jgi:hypothetical protein
MAELITIAECSNARLGGVAFVKGCGGVDVTVAADRR